MYFNKNGFFENLIFGLIKYVIGSLKPWEFFFHIYYAYLCIYFINY